MASKACQHRVSPGFSTDSVMKRWGMDVIPAIPCNTRNGSASPAEAMGHHTIMGADLAPPRS